MEEKSMSKGLKFCIFLILVGLIMTVTSVGDAYRLMFKDTKDLKTKTLDNFTKNEMVDGKVQYVFDEVATLESTKTMYGVPYSKEKTPYYLVMITDKDDIVQGYVVMHITNKDDISKFKNLVNSTLNLMDDPNVVMPDPVSVQTKTTEMPDDLKKIVYDYFEEGGMTKAECDELVADCVLEQNNYKTSKIMPLIGIGIMVLGVVIIIAVKASGKGKKVYVNEIPQSTVPNPTFSGSVPNRYGDQYKAMEEQKDQNDDFLGKM